MMKTEDRQEGLMSAYRGAKPGAYIEEASKVNHTAWSLVVVAIGLIFWLVVALINAENQRNALLTNACQDRVFPAELASGCLESVKTREHWWQHVLYAVSHVRS